MAREAEVTLTLKADPSHCRSALLCYSVFVYEKCHLPILEGLWARGIDSVPFRLKHLLQAQRCTCGEGSSIVTSCSHWCLLELVLHVSCLIFVSYYQSHVKSRMSSYTFFYFLFMAALLLSRIFVELHKMNVLLVPYIYLEWGSIVK